MMAMRAVENACSRFDGDSELSALVNAPAGKPVSVSPILFQSIQFACEVADWTDGRFDPTVGHRMEELGFKRHYLTGDTVSSPVHVSKDATYRDIELDPNNQTVCLHRPMKLDLGAVAKGLAVDLAVKELNNYGFPGFVVDAGGDVFASGMNELAEPWRIGIRHPVQHADTILSLCVKDAAVCTSGTYERRSPIDAGSHHILNARTKHSAGGILSLTAMGPYTMMADALSTAAFLYPWSEALEMLASAGLEGVIVTEDLQSHLTPGMGRYVR